MINTTQRSRTMSVLICFLVFFLLIFSNCQQASNRSVQIDTIELYRVDVEKVRHFSHSTWQNRQHVFLKLSSESYAGWSETIADKNNPRLDIRRWGYFLLDLKGRTLDEAFDLLEQRRKGGTWEKRQLEFTELALIDLAAHTEGISANEYLGLTGDEPVPGLFTILEDNPVKVAEQAQLAKEQGFTSHIKIKLFGNQQLDQQVIEQVRKVMGPAAFILGDVNRGYTSFETLDDLAVILRSLYDNGLDACEDPAELTNRQWVALQYKVGDLALVPDRPTRTSWLALDSLVPDMGRYYNMHPAGLGSIRHMIPVTEQIKEWGHGIMIGDASLIGPGCSAWQQLAIGVGASWVEAIEKPQENDVFLKATVSQATFRENDLIDMKPQPGFGLEVDDQFLKRMADDYCSL